MFQKVVAHFVDHQIVKGTSLDVDPQKPVCHVRTGDQQTVEVDLSQLKALYFVKDLDGNPERNESSDPASDDARLRGSTMVDITFLDGERLGALTNRYPPRGPYFYVLPMDPSSNNQRILINREAVTSMAVRAGSDTSPSEPANRPRPKRTTWVFDGSGLKEVPVDN